MKLFIILTISLLLKLGFHLALADETFVSDHLTHDNEHGSPFSVGVRRYLKSSKSASISLKSSKSKRRVLKSSKSDDLSEKYSKSKGKGKSGKSESEKFSKSKGKSSKGTKGKAGKSSSEKDSKSKGKSSKSDYGRPKKRNRVRKGVKTEKGKGKMKKKCRKVRL